MKNNSSTTFLLAALVVSVLLSLGLFWGAISKEREMRELRPQAQLVSNNRALVQSLLNEAMEYSKKNPAITPILEGAGKAPHSAQPASRPGTK